MKNPLLYLSIILLIAISFLNADCNGTPPEPQIPVYNYTEAIVNPPDVFQIMYNISFFGDRIAYVKFEDDAVWQIQKIGDSRINFWVTNDSASHYITMSDTLGLKAGYTYIFGANNNNYEEFNTLFSQFNKLATEYDNFESKF